MTRVHSPAYLVAYSWALAAWLTVRHHIVRSKP